MIFENKNKCYNFTDKYKSMKEIERLTFPALFANTLLKHGDRPAMALVGENPVTYNELDRKIKALIAWLEKLGIKQGDKIAILSSSTPNSVSYTHLTLPTNREV